MVFGIKGLKPELDEPKYWVHLIILAAVVLGIFNPYSSKQRPSHPPSTSITNSTTTKTIF
jgi:hypothetical protein